jgi:hypothetical protein
MAGPKCPLRQTRVDDWPFGPKKWRFFRGLGMFLGDPGSDEIAFRMVAAYDFPK